MDNFEDELDKCMRLLDENVDVLNNIEFELDDRAEDEVVTDLKLHNLYDMVEDVSTSAKLKRAESNFMRRQAE